ncbi:MAG: hypothetical protein JRJ14_04785 [Deltaproteobacteria bacterium]|nr:hypothetical protein [Deltaproteobacteria bacterium]
MKKKVIEVTYTFDVSYKHKDHLESIENDLLKEPIFNMSGAGVASDDIVYSYNCKMRQKGKIIK